MPQKKSSSKRCLITMLQKFSKCEVKVWLCWNLIILTPLWFHVKSYFGEFSRAKNVIFGNFRNSKFWVLVNIGLESCSNWLKSKFRTSKIAKMTFFDCLNLPKFDFTQNQSGGKMIQFQQSQALTSHFESFWNSAYIGFGYFCTPHKHSWIHVFNPNGNHHITR